MPRPSRARADYRRLLVRTTALWLALPALASASDILFAGPGSDWFDAANWTGGLVPGAADSATIGSGTEAVIFAQTATVDTLSVNGSLLVRDPLVTQSAIIDTSGTMTLSGTLADWRNSGALLVGENGSATLAIIEGATASTGTLSMATTATGSSALLLEGDGSSLTVSDRLDAGLTGTATISISAGALLATSSAGFGILAGSSGTLTVDGDGSAFTTGTLSLGESGSGSLTITAGGATTVTGDATLGAATGGSGAASLRGAGSSLTVGGILTIGEAGSGALTLAEGATVTSLSARIGAASGGSGAVSLSGLDTRWTVTDHLDIGTGTLSLDTAASLSTGSATLGSLSGASASATLSGSGTQWTNTEALTIGAEGNGSLTVKTGASVSTVSATVAATASGSGSVSVDGEGSSLAVTGSFDVGRLGTGTLSITAGASASAGTMSLGTEAGSSGAAMVDGEGSSLTVAGNFDIGRMGSGVLTVSGGATVSAGSITIAGEAGSTGTLNIGTAESELAAGAGALDTAAIVFGEGDGTLVFNHGETDYTLSAAISGTGTVKAVRGTTILTGDNSYDGLTTIASGATLAVGDGGVSGTLGSGDVENEGSLIFDRVGALAFSGAISGTGTLTKTGSGTLTLSGDSTYSGATTVTEGELAVDGSLASAISVESGATLSGSGAVGATAIADGGTLAAEGLAVNGDLALASGATFATTTGAQGIVVSGTADLGGASVSLAYEAGSALSNRYTLVTADSIDGSFGTVSTSGLSSRFTVSALSDDTTAGLGLVYDGSSAALSGTGANGVHAVLARAFNGGTVLSGSLSTALASDGTAFQQSMTALSGETGASARILGSLALEDFLASASAAGSRFSGETGDPDLWARLTGTSQTFDSQAAAGIGAASANLAGIEGGTRVALDSAWNAGAAISLGHARYAAEDVDASADGIYGQAALHAAGHFANGGYLTAALGGGLIAVETRRNPGSGDRVEGDFVSPFAGLSLEGGQRFEVGDFALTPFAGAALVYSHAPAYRETAVAGSGNPALAYDGLDQWTATLRAGLEARWDTAIDGGSLSFYTRLAYLHRFASDGTTGAAFTALADSYFDLESLTREGGAAAVAVGAVVALGPRTDLRFDVSGEWGRDHRSLTGKAGFNFKW